MSQIFEPPPIHFESLAGKAREYPLLQIVHAQLVLLFEDVLCQRLDVREVVLLRSTVYRFIEVKGLIHHGTVVYMIRYGIESVILWNGSEILLAVVLAQGLVVPYDAFLHIVAVQARLIR